MLAITTCTRAVSPPTPSPWKARAPREQLVVRALLDDAPRLHDEDDVGVADRREPVRDDEGRPVRAQRPIACCTSSSVRVSTDEVASSRMSSAGSERNARAMVMSCFSPAERLLPPRRAPCRSRRAASARSGRRRSPGRREDLLLGRAGPAVGDVVADRPGEQPGVLQHHADPAAQIVAR
jgi:hypothetical protein